MPSIQCFEALKVLLVAAEIDGDAVGQAVTVQVGNHAETIG
jgi:hypothetical protein